MKNLLIILVLFCSCAKEQVETMSAKEQYTIQFEVEDETATDQYLIQVSTNGLSYETVDTLKYSLSNAGVYTYQLAVKENTFVRVASGEPGKMVYSPIVISK